MYIWARGLEERAEALQMGTCFMKAFETRAWEGVLYSEGLAFKWDGNGEKAENDCQWYTLSHPSTK